MNATKGSLWQNNDTAPQGERRLGDPAALLPQAEHNILNKPLEKWQIMHQGCPSFLQWASSHPEQRTS